MMPRKGRLDVAGMKSFIDKTMKSLGAEMRWDPDEDLLRLKKGAPLLLKDLRELPDGSPVWVTWKEHGERGFRINQAMRACRDEQSGPDYRTLNDGSSFGADFDAEFAADDECFDSKGGVGEMFLFKAEPKGRRKSADFARTRRRR